MIQFYALSVFLTILAGYALISRDTSDRGTPIDGVRAFLADPVVRLLVGIMDVFVGFFKLLAVMRGDIPVIGDLLPAVAGMASGFTLLLETYQARSPEQTDLVKRLEGIFLHNKRIIGFTAMASGLIHFLFAQVLFL